MACYKETWNVDYADFFSRLSGLVPEKTGLLVPFQVKKDGTYEPRDPGKFSRDLAAALNRVLRSPALRKKFADAGRRRAETQFSWAGVAKKTHALYRSLVK